MLSKACICAYYKFVYLHNLPASYLRYIQALVQLSSRRGVQQVLHGDLCPTPMFRDSV